MILAATQAVNAAVTEEVNAAVTEEVNVIVTEDVKVTAIVTDGVRTTVIMTAALTDAISFPSEIRPAAVKTINDRHNFSKDLKFNISKSECHVIICMAFFFVIT